MYETQQLLGQIDDRTTPILIGFAIAMAFQTVWLVGAVLAARRERVYSLPLFLTFFWFAHDFGCVVRFDDWFNTYDHWFLKCFWVGLLSAMLLEFVFLGQAIKYGREELAPALSQRAWAALVLAGAGMAVLVWELLKVVLSDPLYQASPALTLALVPGFGAALLLRRRSAVGQTVLMWQCCTGICAAWWITTVAFYGGRFDSWQYIALGAVTVAGAAAMTLAVRHARATDRASASWHASPPEDLLTRQAIHAPPAGA